MSLWWVAGLLIVGCGDGTTTSPPDAPPDGPPLELSTLTADPIRMLGDGRTKASIIVTLRDVNGEPISGRDIQLATSGAESALDATNLTSDSDGVAVTTLTARGSGTATISARSQEIELETTVLTDAVATPCAGTQLLPFPPMLDVAFFKVADLNGDQFPDFLGTLGGRPDALYVSLGNGDGTFDPPTLTSLVDDGLLLADVDGDGALDAIERTQPLQVSLNNGDGTFQAPLQIPTIPQGLAIAAGDFDDDNKTDLAFVNPSVNELQVATGNGDGTFDAATSTGVNASFAKLITEDIDEDGITDLVMTPEGSSSILVMISNGAGGFLPATTLSFNVQTISDTRVADADNDGHLDLLTRGTDQSQDSLLIKPGNGDGTFEATISLAAPRPLGDIAVGDIDHDGVFDVAFGLPDGAGIVTTHSNGDGTFAPMTESVIGRGFFQRFSLADFNNDGKLDIAHDEGIGAVIELATAQGFAPVTTALDPSRTNIRSWSTTLADLDRDGHLDVIAALSQLTPPGVLATFRGNGDGTFGQAIEFGESNVVESLATGDFDRDGDPDVVVARGTPTETMIEVFRNDSGVLVSTATIPTGMLANQLLVGDFDGDSRLDLLIANLGKLLLVRGDGLGGFSTPESQTLTTPQTQLISVRAGDMDNDGALDLIVATNPATLSLLRNLGDGSFGLVDTEDISGGVVIGANEVFGLAVADFDDDGQLDVAAGVREPLKAPPNTRLWLVPGVGATFDTPIISSEVIQGRLSPFDVVDLDRDGVLDVVVGNVSYGNGDGTFTESGPYPLLETLADLDHDGMLDSVASGVVARQAGCL